MKNHVKIVLLVLLTAGISSCEKIKSLFDVEFNSTFSGDMDIDIQDPVTKSTSSYEFHSATSVDPLDDADFAQYVDNIKDIAVSGVVAEVLFVNKENVLFESGTTFSITDSHSTVSWILGSDWEIVEGTEITLDDIGGGYGELEDILNKKGAFTISAEGVSSETNVAITLRIGIDTEITASPL